MPEELHRYQFLFESVDYGIIIRDQHGLVTEANPAAEKILGYSLNTLRRQSAYSGEWAIVQENGEPFTEAEHPSRTVLRSGKRKKNIILGFYHPKMKSRRWLKADYIPELEEGQHSPDKIYEIYCDITDQKTVCDHLELYREAVEHSGNAVGIATADGKHYYQNKAFSDLFGEIGIDPISTAYVDKKIGKNVFDTIRKGSEWKGIVKMYDRNGEVIDIKLRAYPIFDQSNNIIGLVGVHSDITEELRATSKLTESEAKLRMALEGAQADSWIVNLKTREMNFGDRWAGFFGYDTDEVPKTIEAIQQLLHPDDKAQNQRRLEQHFKGESPVYEAEVRIKNKQGSYSWVLVRGKITEYDDQKNPLKMIGTSFDITERIQTREVIQDSEEKLRKNVHELETIINALPGMVSVVDKDFNVLLANREVIKVFGKSDPAEVIGLKCHKSRKDLDDPCPQCALVQAFETKKMVTRLSVPDEEDLMGMATKAYAVPLLDEEGEVYGGVEVIMDVSDLRKAEFAIQQSEKKFRHMIEHGGECITLIDQHGKIIYESPTIKYLTGYNPDERIGKTATELIYKEDLPAVKKILSTVAKSPGDSMIAQFRGVKKNGEIYWISGTATNLLHDPSVRALVINFRDITKQKDAEEALRKSEERFRRIFEEGQIGMAIIGLNQTVEAANPALCKMLGYSQDEMTKIGMKDVTLPDEFDFYTEKVKKLVSGEIKQIRGEKQYIRKDKTLLWTSISVSAMRNEKGKIEYFLGLIKDVTDLKKTEDALQSKVAEYQSLNLQYRAQNKELLKTLDQINSINRELEIAKDKAEESDRLKTAFLANMSHEIRTPMNGILGFTDLLKQTDVSHKDFQKYLDIIQKSGYRMLSIINDLIDISRIEAGQVEVDIKSTHVNKVLDNFYNFFLPEATRKKLDLFYHKGLDDSSCLIETDEVKLGQILSNLIKNALKYTAEGKIVFGYQKIRKNLQFYVEDSGTGIDPGSQKIIFERFMQGRHEKGEPVEGSGLGLAISKAFLELLGGKIWVDSKRGKGSKFFFTLPYIPVKEDKAILKKKKDIEFEGDAMTILLAEDDESSRVLFEEVFDKYPVKLICVNNGEHAVKAVKENRDIDLVLMDIKMPVMDGLDATRAIKKIKPDLPVIAQTAFASMMDSQRALEAGCDDYITKPVHRQLLLEITNRFLKLK